MPLVQSNTTTLFPSAVYKEADGRAAEIEINTMMTSYSEENVGLELEKS
jgi:hypothetical protein